MTRQLSRRAMLAGTAGLIAAPAFAQTPAPNAQLGTPPSTITQPAARLVARPSGDLSRPRHRRRRRGVSAAFRRQCRAAPAVGGCLLGRGPARSSQGRYLVFSDVQASIRTAASGSPTRPMATGPAKATPTRPAAPPTRRGSPSPRSASPITRRSAAGSANCRPPSIAGTRAASSRWSYPSRSSPDPNGLCFSPDYKTLYVISAGAGPGDTGPGGKRDIHAFFNGVF
jgi:hypothetical protein